MVAASPPASTASSTCGTAQASTHAIRRISTRSKVNRVAQEGQRGVASALRLLQQIRPRRSAQCTCGLALPPTLPERRRSASSRVTRTDCSAGGRRGHEQAEQEAVGRATPHPTQCTALSASPARRAVHRPARACISGRRFRLGVKKASGTLVSGVWAVSCGGCGRDTRLNNHRSNIGPCGAVRCARTNKERNRGPSTNQGAKSEHGIYQSISQLKSVRRAVTSFRVPTHPRSLFLIYFRPVRSPVLRTVHSRE
jgi:hypothetical protein